MFILDYYTWFFSTITNGDDWYTAFALVVVMMHVVICAVSFGIMYGLTKWDGYVVEHFNEWREARDNRIATSPEGYNYKTLWQRENREIKNFFKALGVWAVILLGPLSLPILLAIILGKLVWVVIKSFTLFPQMVESFRGE